MAAGNSDHHRILTELPVPDAAVDYVFVDPPFGENIPYSDLAILVEHWHRVQTATVEEATEDPVQEIATWTTTPT